MWDHGITSFRLKGQVKGSGYRRQGNTQALARPGSFADLSISQCRKGF